ncbi:MAG TPA: rhodanese-like domain-containing protein [Streptosporangiaceae bacterium]|nr:rhodanese-like domain-containing protein [Streptosporangiaceae bacterium]
MSVQELSEGKMTVRTKDTRRIFEAQTTPRTHRFTFKNWPACRWLTCWLPSRRAVVLDARSADAFAHGHLRGSLNVRLECPFAEYAGQLVGAGENTITVCNPGRAHEARVGLSRVGLDSIAGVLDQPATAFPAP